MTSRNDEFHVEIIQTGDGRLGVALFNLSHVEHIVWHSDELSAWRAVRGTAAAMERCDERGLALFMEGVAR